MRTRIKFERKERGKIGQNLAALIGGFGLGGLFRRSKELAFDLTKIKSALYYLRGVVTVRQFFFGVFQIICSALFLFFGVVMIHVGVWMLLPWSDSNKALAIVILGGIYFLTFLFVLLYFFSGDRWLKGAFRYNPLIEQIMKDNCEKK